MVLISDTATVFFFNVQNNRKYISATFFSGRQRVQNYAAQLHPIALKPD